MARCKSCGAEVTWAEHHDSGNPMPLEPADEEQIEDGRGLWRIESRDRGRPLAYAADRADAMGLFPVQVYVSHFATCPDADTWREDDDA